jgi:hypothetical protein
MVIAVDWDGTIVEQDGRTYADVTSPFKLMPGALDALRALKSAGHKLILWSGRANHALRFDPMLDPLVRAGVKKVDMARWETGSRDLNQARFDQMVSFAETELDGIFDAIDDGKVGKVSADLYIDDRALRFGVGLSGARWADIAKQYGARST